MPCELGEADVEAAIGLDDEPQAAAGAELERPRASGVALLVRHELDPAHLGEAADASQDLGASELPIVDAHACLRFALSR